MPSIKEIAKAQIKNIPVNRVGYIIEEGKAIGRCNKFDVVDLIENRCPQGYIISLYTCKRCRHFKSI